MEKRSLSPRFHKVIDDFNEFRSKYTAMKAHCAAQEKLIEVQKLELAKLNSRVEKMGTALVDYQRCSSLGQQNLELENKRLLRIIENSRNAENVACDSKLQRDKDEHIERLEIELVELRSKIDVENEKHRIEMKSVRERHETQINAYITKLNALDKVSKKPEHCREENTTVTSDADENNTCGDSENNSSKGKQVTCTHPAFDESSDERRKTSVRFRWAQLGVTVKNGNGIGTKSPASQPKRKKLFHLDNDAVVDLSSQ